MKLSELQNQLIRLESLTILRPDGSFVLPHFHITEIGLTTKKYVDCGGTIREEIKIGMQLWEADDNEHRLSPQRLLSILELSQCNLDLPDAEIEVEYQSSTIGKYSLDFDGHYFHLRSTLTDCLAPDKCGVSTEKKKVSLKELSSLSDMNSCTPDSGCC